MRPRSSEKELEFDADEVLSIRDPELLRAVSARRLLAGCGNSFRASAGTDETYNLSAPVMWIDAFLSHAWSTPGWLKYVVMLYRTNGRCATFVAMLAEVVMHGGEILGLWLIPHLYTGRAYLVEGHRPSQIYLRLHFVVALAAFWLTLLFGQYIPSAGQRRYFLDKICIHQTDMTRKEAAIHMLGAFLRRSKCMLVLWQPQYFRRAWCVFELAAFLHINRPSADAPEAVADIDFVPLKLPLLALGLNLFHTVSSVGAACCLPLASTREHAEFVATAPGPVQLLYIFAVLTAILFFLYLVPAVFLWGYVRQHLLDRRTLLCQLHSFTLAETECFSVEDLFFVRSKVTKWFGSRAKFDTYVREVLTEKVRSIVVRPGPIPYRFVLFGSLPHLFTAASASLEAFRCGETRVGWQTAVMGANLFAVADPIAMAFVLRIAAARLDAPAAGGASVRCLAGPVTTAAVFAVSTALALASATPTLPLWAAFAILLVEAAVVAYMYRGQPEPVRATSGPPEGLPGPKNAAERGDAPEVVALGHSGPRIVTL